MLQWAVGIEVHHGPGQAVAGGRHGDQVHLQDLAILVPRQSADVDDDGVHDQHGEAQEEVEAEESHVGGGRGVEEQREAVHPGCDGHPVGYQEDQEDGKDVCCNKVDVLWEN